jgi:PPOX class probable F420-dependent enzyme
MFDFNTEFGRFAIKHIKKEYFIWLTTVDSTGTPQPKPVWYIWDNDSFLIFSQAKAHKLKHIQKNPNVSLHFNTEDAKGEKRLIVISGLATVDRDNPPANRIRAYMRKYKDGISDLNAMPEQFAQEYSVAIRINPTNVRGWE